MLVRIVTKGECIIINTVISDDSIQERMDPTREAKWVKFCKKHRFNPRKDYNTKIYRLYLDLCINGLV